MSVIDDVELGTKRGSDRYKIAIDKHLSSIYTKANLVQQANMVYTTDQLKRAILRPVHPGDYDGLNTELTPAEKEIEIYLNKQFAEVNIADILSKFSKAPYGWDDICTIYVINELVRRHKRDYSYSNNPNVETSTVASHIVTEKNKFTVRQAQAISQELVTCFTDAWKDIFGITATFATNDSTQIIRLCRDAEGENSLTHRRDAYKKLDNQYSSYQFIKPIREAIDLFDEWLAVRDPQKFFNAVIEKREYAHQLMDTCKEVIGFIHDQMDNYQNIIDFARDNRENFHALGSEYKEQIEAIEKFEHMGWPIKIREIIKMRNSLTAALDEQRNAIREEIKKAYNETFDLLERSAETQDVSKSILSDRAITIQLKTKSNSLSVLRININTDDFYAEQASKIQAEVIRRKPKTPPYPVPQDEDDRNNTHVCEEKFTNMSLNTRTVTPLKSEKDVNEYLEKLRIQLMEKISDGYSVTIIK